MRMQSEAEHLQQLMLCDDWARMQSETKHSEIEHFNTIDTGRECEAERSIWSNLCNVMM